MSSDSQHGRAPNRAFVSYGFPILIFGFFFFFSDKTSFQKLLLFMWVVHFTKRLLETRYVHIYSPGKDMHGCFTSKAFVFYIVFSLWIGFEVHRTSYPGRFSNFTLIYVVLFFASVILNAIHHYMLRLLKTESERTKQRIFPNGLGEHFFVC